MTFLQRHHTTRSDNAPPLRRWQPSLLCLRPALIPCGPTLSVQTHDALLRGLRHTLSALCSVEGTTRGSETHPAALPISHLSHHAAQTETQTGALTATQLHARYLDDVYRYVARRMAQREDAEDITAEVFGAAFQALPRFRGEVEPRLWLLGIARRKVADALRRGRGRRAASWDEAHEDGANALVAPGSSDPARVIVQREAAATMRRVLAGLKDEQREVLLLKYVEELSTAEIAVVLGRSVAAANSLLQRARATALRQGRAYFHDLHEEVPTVLPSAAITREVRS